MLTDRLAEDLFRELCRFPIIDLHAHLDPQQPTARSLDDLLSYQVYRELAQATGLDKGLLAPGTDPQDRVRATFYHLIDFFPNTAPHRWLLELARVFLGFHGERLTLADCTTLATTAERLMAQPGWEEQVIRQSNIESIIVPRRFDDPLTGFDTRRYVPCLRAGELVQHFDRTEVRQWLALSTGVEVGDAAGLRRALGTILEHFTRHGARSVMLTLPSTFTPLPVSDADFERALSAVPGGTTTLTAEEIRQTCARGVFRALLEQCHHFQLPLHLLLGDRNTVPDLVHQQEALLAYTEVMQTFPGVTFCLTVGGSGQEVVNLSRVFPNVFSCGHGRDIQSVPVALERSLRFRLQALPQTKQVGYYSNAERLEFCLPQFNMYRRILAQALADDFVRPRYYTVGQALQLGRLLLRDNARRIFDV